MRRPRFCQKVSIRAAGKGQRETQAALRMLSPCPSVTLLTPASPSLSLSLSLFPPPPPGQPQISLKKSQPLQKIITVAGAAFAFWFFSLWGWRFHALLGSHQECIYLFLMKSTSLVLCWGWALANKELPRGRAQAGRWRLRGCAGSSGDEDEDED